MQHGSPILRALSKAILEAEASAAGEATAQAAERAFGRLSTHLSRLLGGSGCAALLGRAAYLAAQDAPVWTGATISITPTVAVNGFVDRLTPLTEQEAMRASLTLLTCLIWLLAEFIGDDIVIRLVHDIWPEIPSVGESTDREESPR